MIRRTFGQGTVIYAGSSLEAVYEETRMKPVRDFMASLLDPLLQSERSYYVEPRPGLMPHFTISGDSLLLHLLANTGNKWKKLRLREEYLPIPDVAVRIRLPQGRDVKAVRLLRTGKSAKFKRRDAWLELSAPEVLIHELVEVELS